MDYKVSFLILASLLSIVSFRPADAACSDPGLHEYTERTTEGFDTGNKVEYSCYQGYELNSGLSKYVLECQPSGSWNGSAPICSIVVCPEPEVIENADLVGGREYGQEVTYTCHLGHRKLDGSRVTRMTCQADGTWTRTPQACNPVQCPKPEMIPYANKTEGPFFYNQSVEYTCMTGYLRVSGNSALTCGPDGYWLGSWPQCNEILCGDPGLISNAGRDITGIGFNATVTYRCIRGYERDVTGGDLIRHCQSDQTWSGDDPRCTGVSCGDPGQVDNASRDPTSPSFRYPESIRYTCDVGYKPDFRSGIDEVTCMWDARWDFAPMSCSRVRCLETNYSVNTQILNGQFYYGDVKQMSCLSGYTLESGNLERTCTESGRFSGSVPVCQKKDCGDPGEIEHGEKEGNKTKFRDMISYTCDNGFEIVGEIASIKRTIMCEASGSWSKPAPVCTRVTCGYPTQGVNMEVVRNDGVYFGDLFVIACNHGYELAEGNATRRCKANKVWEGAMPVCRGKDCGEPALPPHSQLIGRNFRYPNRVYFNCLEGYERKDGDEMWSCEADASWRGDPLQCQRIQCYPPDTIPNADLIPGTLGQTEFRFKDPVTYSCREGHIWSSTSGSLNRTCESNRMWSGKRPVCERVSCGDPGDQDGAYKLGISFKYRDIVNYTCKTGYEVEDGVSWSVLTCQANQSWSGMKPDCQLGNFKRVNEAPASSVFCGDPGPALNNSYRTVFGLHYLQSVKYHCTEGYYIRTISDLRCMEDKKWSHPVPNCTEIPDFEPLDPLPPPDPPSEAKDATTVGYIGLSLVIAEVTALVLLDLTTICRDLRVLRRNIGAGLRDLRTRVRPTSASQVGSEVTLTSDLDDISTDSDTSSSDEE